MQQKQVKPGFLVHVILCLLLLPAISNAQYLETFSTPNKGYLTNLVNDFTGVGWTLSAWANQPPAEFGRDDQDYFQTTADGRLEGIDFDQEVCWTSPALTVQATGNISFTADITWAQFDENQSNPLEFINVEYQINGGAWVRHPNVLGANGDLAYTVRYIAGGTNLSGSATINFPSIAVTAGQTVVVRFCASMNQNAEVVTLDNVNVTGVSSGCAAPNLSVTVQQVGCSNPNSGAVFLSVSGGTPPYSYDWSNDGPENPDNDPKDLIGVPTGMYTVTVTDGANCTATISANVTNAPAIMLSTQVLNASCSGNTDGEIDLIVSGGVPGYTYDWSNDGPENPDNDPQDLIGVGTGTYTVTVTDLTGCTATTSAMVGVQTPGPYLEQFNIAGKGFLPGFVNDFSAVSWTLSSWANQPPATFGRDNDDYFYTTGGVLTGIDFDQEVCWTSPLIARNTATQFSVDLAWTGFDNQTDEYINVKYSIDGGAYTTVSNKVGGGAGTIQYTSGLDQNGSTTVTQTGLTGTTLRIQICAQTNAESESVTIDNVSVPGSSTYCPAPVVMLTPTHVTCPGGTNGAIQVTASSGVPGYNVSWSGPSSGNPAGTEISTSGGSYNITGLAAGTYSVTVTGANGSSATTPVTLNTLNPAQNADFAYGKSSYCKAGSNPSPVIYGTTGGTFSAPPQVSINAGSGQINLSASTAGGPYTITYITPGPCAASATFAVSIVNCTPGATLTDAIVIDNGTTGKADPGDRIRLTATISNAQTAQYEGVQLALNNDPRVTLVTNSFKSTPIAVEDAYTATLNTPLVVLVGSGVLQNDFDDNIPGLSVTAFSATSMQGGTVSVNANGSFTYTPPMGFTGNDSFTYTITDSDAQTDVGTVKIRVQ